MAKDDVASENPPSNGRLRQFRKLFNDYTNNGVKKPSAQRSNNSPTTNSPSSTPEKRSSASRAPRPRRKINGAEPPSPSSPSTGTPEKENIVEAKDLAKADDEEFENDGTEVERMAKCTIKMRDLQWKAGVEDKKVPEVHAADKKVYKSSTAMDLGAERGVRRRRSSTTPKKKSRKKTGSGSSPAPVTPSAETVEDDITPEKGVRSRAKRSTNKPEPRPATPSSEPLTETDALPEIDENSADFKQAIKLMGILKRNNLLENALFPAQNQTLKVFFDGGMRNVDNKILGLISKAMDFVLDAVFFRGEDLDCMLEADMKKFIADRSKSKPILLDVIICRPEFLPQSWGGRIVVLRGQPSDTVVNVEPKDKK